MIEALHGLALVGYGGAWLSEMLEFRRELRSSWRLGFLAICVGVVAQLAGLTLFSLRFHTLPLVGVGPASSTLAFAIACFALVVVFRRELRAAGLFLLPLSLLLLGEAVDVGLRPGTHITAFKGPWFVTHVASLFVAYGALALASAAAAMYLLQLRSLKGKKFGSVFRFFPSLDSLERLHTVGLGLGFPLLTLGLITGWSWTLTEGRGLALGDPQVVFGMVSWVAYLAAVVIRMEGRRRSSLASRVTSLAFLLSAVTFFALRLLARRSGVFL